jgi:hypothetical protein
MTNRIRIAAAVALLALAPILAAATEDTRENRIEAAKSYLKVVPMQSMIQDAARELAVRLPEDRRGVFLTLLTEEVRVSVLEQASLDAMVKHFTVAEIEAMVAFYGSEEGQRILQKQGKYMAEIAPIMQQEMLRALAAAQQRRP